MNLVTGAGALVDPPRAGWGQFGSAVAEREGFEPSVRLPLRHFSKVLLSATQPSLRLLRARQLNCGRSKLMLRSRRASTGDLHGFTHDVRGAGLSEGKFLW